MRLLTCLLVKSLLPQTSEFNRKNMKEEYRPIKGFEDEYTVSTTGKIFSTYKNRHLNPFIIQKGAKYLAVFLYKNGSRIRKRVHRLVAETFLGESNGREVNHIDRDKTNNHVDNLEWCTRKQNMRHLIKIGHPKLHFAPIRVMAVKDGTEYTFESLRAGGVFFGCDYKKISNHIAGKVKEKVGGACWYKV